MQPPLSCPDCGSGDFIKDGHRYIRSETGSISLQRYICKRCGRKFSESNSAHAQDQRSNPGGKPRSDVELFGTYSQRCPPPITSDFKPKGKLIVSSHGGSGTSSVRVVKATHMQKTARLETERGTRAKPEVIIQLQKFALWLQDEGIKQVSINTYVNVLLSLVKHGAVLNEPETIRRVLGQQTQWKDSYRHMIADVYSKYVNFQGLKWRKPRYQDTNELIFIPSERELILAVNCGSKGNRVFAQFIYEVGCRLNEAEALKWIDIDREKRLVDIKKSKNGNPRRLKVSSELIDMLLSLPKNHETVFTPLARGTRGILFHKRMQSLARKSSNPRFVKIHLHTFRHCKALREYHRTKDILHVKYLLGHRTLRATQRYVEMYKNVYGNLRPQDYIVKIVRTSEEAKDLLKVGFEFINEIDGEFLYRKAKID